MANVRSITPLPPADFTPELGNYKTLQPFRYWCQKVLPLVYDDSLSYYELLCKLVDYLNKAMEDVETLHGDVTNMYTAYDELQSYVNNYFTTLDVQEEINNKLDIMASNGELYEIIRRYTDPIVNDQNVKINDQNDKINVLKSRMDTFTSLPDGSTAGDAELQDIRIGYNGKTYPSAGDAVRTQVSALEEYIVKKIHVYDNSFLDTIYGDANTVPLYSFVFYSYIDGMKNLPPTDNKGLLITLSSFDRLLAETQIYIESNTNILWIRSYANKKWNSWVSFPFLTSEIGKANYAIDSKTVGDAIKNMVSGVGYLVYEEATEPLNDFNNLDTNKIYGYTAQTNLINAPMKDFNGIVCTWGYMNASKVQIQYAITFTTSMVFCRSLSAGKWTNWSLVNPENAVFEVGPGKQYTDPISCFNTVKDYAFHKKIVIYEGEYDIYQLMGGHKYFANIDPSSATSYDFQPWLSDVEIVGKGRVIFKMNIPNDIPNNITWLFSPLNIRGNASIKNITIKGSNIRYCIHDESAADYPNTVRLYENVNCEIDTHVAIGCGYSPNTKITLVNCKLHSNSGGAYSYHSKGGITFNAQNCIFSSDASDASCVRFSEENSGKIDKVILSNCFLEGGSSIEIRGEWVYSPSIGHTDITLINTKATNIKNGYDSLEESIISYNTITGEKNILVN